MIIKRYSIYSKKIWTDLSFSLVSLEKEDYKLLKDTGTIEIPKFVTEINPFILKGNSMLTHLDTANIKRLPDGFCSNCPNLKYVSGNALKIGTTAFSNCRSLLSATFPNADYVGVGAFKNCPHLQEVTFGINNDEDEK